MNITDEHGRTFKSLRLSLTQSCNLACTYCVDDWKSYKSSNQKFIPLSWQELIEKVAQLHELFSFKKIRLTGGEPTLYPYLDKLIIGLKLRLDCPLHLTTNGLLLHKWLLQIPNGYLQGINLSLDTLNEGLFQQISRRKGLPQVLEALEECLKRNIPLKLNTVMLRDVNESQLLPLALFAKERNITLRLLENMDMGHQVGSTQYYSKQQALDLLSEKFQLSPLVRQPSDTTQYFQDPDGWKIGFITNRSESFCHDCDRLRMDTQGKLYGCITQLNGYSFPENIYDFAYWQSLLAQKQAIFKGSEVKMIERGG